MEQDNNVKAVTAVTTVTTVLVMVVFAIGMAVVDLFIRVYSLEQGMSAIK